MSTNENIQKNQHFGMQMAVFLLGLTIGGLYVGMISPVRTVIQADFGVDSATGIWMINIYTLFYAALIPVIGKIADIYGRKRVFVLCLVVFAVGATLCGLSALALGMPLLLAGRVVQAVGACGMIPVANAEMGTAFPPEKRGLALGLAAGISGIANVLGAAIGSAILGVIGSANWPVLFYISLPFCAITLIGALVFIPNRTAEDKTRLDILGSVVLVCMVLSLLLGLRELDFFDFGGTITRLGVWLPLLLFVALLLVFGRVEKRAESPVFHLEYLRNLSIRVTMIVSFFIGCVSISMTLIPELAEVTLGMPTGSGGYYVAAVGVFAMFGPPIGGKLIDRFGPKRVLGFGLVVGAIGFLFLAFVAVPVATPATMIIGLCLMGLGMGFSMGAPTNYMILKATDECESTSAIATLTLVRQVGCSVAPAILVGFTTSGLGSMGYQGMLICVAVFCAFSFVAALRYRER